jgi:hypothetical protein
MDRRDQPMRENEEEAALLGNEEAGLPGLLGAYLRRRA